VPDRSSKKATGIDRRTVLPVYLGKRLSCAAAITAAGRCTRTAPGFGRTAFMQPVLSTTTIPASAKRPEKGGEAEIGDEPAAHDPLVPHGNELVATVMDETQRLSVVAEAQERRLARLRETRGDGDPQTLAAMLDLAETRWAEGRLIAARRLEEKVVAGRRLMLGADHPDTLKALGKLAVTMAAQGELGGARPLQEEVLRGLRARYGEDAAETLRAVNNLAGTVMAAGDLATARQMLEEVVATLSAKFGEDHADSLLAMGNLAAVLWQEGERGEAYELQRRLVALRSRRAGDADDTLLAAARAVLEMMERDPGF
jgi:Tetratricopeptide repeat